MHPDREGRNDDAYVQDKGRDVGEHGAALRAEATILVIVANVRIQILFGPVLSRAHFADEVTPDVPPHYILQVRSDRYLYPITLALQHRCEVAHPLWTHIADPRSLDAHLIWHVGRRTSAWTSHSLSYLLCLSIVSTFTQLELARSQIL